MSHVAFGASMKIPLIASLLFLSAFAQDEPSIIIEEVQQEEIVDQLRISTIFTSSTVRHSTVTISPSNTIQTITISPSTRTIYSTVETTETITISPTSTTGGGYSDLLDLIETITGSPVYSSSATSSMETTSISTTTTTTTNLPTIRKPQLPSTGSFVMPTIVPMFISLLLIVPFLL